MPKSLPEIAKQLERIEELHADGARTNKGMARMISAVIKDLLEYIVEWQVQ